jgi:acetyl esterase/lipase
MDAAVRPSPVRYKQIVISGRSRFFVLLIRLILKPLMRWVVRKESRVLAAQITIASRPCLNTAGLEQSYRYIGGVPGLALGNLADSRKPLVIWIHGGGFLMPASPETHLRMLALLCKDLGAVGIMPDYRLAPTNKFPASLDDCEAVYGALLEAGFPGARIAIGGESAGGNLSLGLLQRIRKRGWAMPSCAVPVSPVTELSRIYAPPSRVENRKRDPMIPLDGMANLGLWYMGDRDKADPELSPLYADYRGFPPLFFLAGETEVLRDDAVHAAQRAHEAGVDTRVDIWPVLPHAFPLFERLFPEVKEARDDIIGFMRKHLGIP